MSGPSRSVTGNDKRGNSYDRRARRTWLISVASGWGGNGEKVPCWECGAMVTLKSMHVDRIVPGEQGGTYRRSNIRPHCAPCSHRQGVRRTREIVAAKMNAMYDPDTDLCVECGVHWSVLHRPDCTKAVIDPW